MSQSFDIQKAIREAMNQALKTRGTANLMVAGKTGVGKSTLVNAIFGANFAETAQGRPVTQHIKPYSKEDIPVCIYDTKGLEVKDYVPILKELTDFIQLKNSSKDPHEHIHVAWICIAEGSRRVEQAEIELVEHLSKLIPVIAVITTAVSDNGFKQTVKELLPNVRNVVRVNSSPYPLDEDQIIPVKGVDNLVELTMEVIPEGQKQAFAAAQRVKLEHKVKRAQKAVIAGATAAGAAAAIPIPFSDAIAIVPVQLGMLASINACFDLNMSENFLGTLISGTFTAVAGTMAGRTLVAALIKFIPGGGSVIGGVISASVAATLTTAFGAAYVKTLEALYKDDPNRQLTAEEVAQAFKTRLGG